MLRESWVWYEEGGKLIVNNCLFVFSASASNRPKISNPAVAMHRLIDYPNSSMKKKKKQIIIIVPSHAFSWCYLHIYIGKTTNPPQTLSPWPHPCTLCFLFLTYHSPLQVEDWGQNYLNCLTLKHISILVIVCIVLAWNLQWKDAMYTMLNKKLKKNNNNKKKTNKCVWWYIFLRNDLLYSLIFLSYIYFFILKINYWICRTHTWILCRSYRSNS
jgi:hypothetical protein